jgi:hypothetical protein
MAIAFTKINSFLENLANKKIDLSGNGLTLALTNTAHTAAWDELADLTLCTGHANTSTKVVTVTSSTQTSGLYKLILADLTITISGDIGPFQYVYLYDDNSTGDKLIGYYDYGSALSFVSGEAFVMDFDATNGVLTIT